MDADIVISLKNPSLPNNQQFMSFFLFFVFFLSNIEYLYKSAEVGSCHLMLVLVRVGFPKPWNTF